MVNNGEHQLFLFIGVQKCCKTHGFGTPHDPGKNKVWQVFDPGAGSTEMLGNILVT